MNSSQSGFIVGAQEYLFGVSHGTDNNCLRSGLFYRHSENNNSDHDSKKDTNT